MNIFLKSIIAGSVVAAASFFISEKKSRQLQLKKYTIHYSIKAEPDTTSSSSFSLSKIIKILEERLTKADFKNEIIKTKENTIQLSLFQMTDTSSSLQFLTSNGKVQFREIYQMQNVLPMLQTTVQVMDEVNDVPKEKTPPSVIKDNMSKEVSDLLDSMEINKRKEKETETTLIQFSQPYENQNAGTTFPAEIGTVTLKDTAAVRKLFNSDKIKLQAPYDLQLCFGEPQIIKNKRKEESTVAMYFIKTYGNTKAVIENEDISDASADFDQYGKPQVTLRFNQYGSRKWANLTERNIGRPIAMLIDNTVISAPNVLSAIVGGSSSISGNFTFQECQLLSTSLKSNKLPAKLIIDSKTIKEEKQNSFSYQRMLVILLIFIGFSVIAFFVFKALEDA